jgi:hypothetical protein
MQGKKGVCVETLIALSEWYHENSLVWFSTTFKWSLIQEGGGETDCIEGVICCLNPWFSWQYPEKNTGHFDFIEWVIV